jgi:hypothetical protein
MAVQMVIPQIGLKFRNPDEACSFGWHMGVIQASNICKWKRKSTKSPMPAKRRAKVCSKPATWTVYADMLLSTWTVYAVFEISMTPGAREQAGGTLDDDGDLELE